MVCGAEAQVPMNVDSKMFFDLIKSEEGIILDVRTPNEYSRGHIEGSTLISTSDQKFIEKVSLLQKGKPVYVYCLTGSRSRAVANYLSQKGYKKVYNLARGILEWQQYGYSVKQSNAVIASSNKTYSNSEFAQLLSSESVVLIDFHAPWCAPCKKMMPTIDKLQKDYSGKALVKKIDIEANNSLKNTYKIQSIPEIVLFKNGKEVWRKTGISSYDDLSLEINKYL